MTSLKQLALYGVLISASISALVPSSSFAAHGTDTGNGGDICEDRFKIVRDDIVSWIKKGGHMGLRLSNGISAKQYKASMLSAISQAKVSCTSKTLSIEGAEKACINFVSHGQSRIVCNADRFLNTDESSQYVLVHHEYAGLAGLEVNDGEDSNYSVSNQISGFLGYEVVKKLAVTCPASPPIPWGGGSAVPTFPSAGAGAPPVFYDPTTAEMPPTQDQVSPPPGSAEESSPPFFDGSLGPVLPGQGGAGGTIGGWYPSSPCGQK